MFGSIPASQRQLRIRERPEEERRTLFSYLCPNLERQLLIDQGHDVHLQISSSNVGGKSLTVPLHEGVEVRIFHLQ